jgi:acetyl esterase/lipase
LFFNGSKEELKAVDKILVHFPGGGFVAQGPMDHADYLRKVSAKLSLPILSVEYRKAPKYPFPAQFYDCFDVYRSVVDSNGGVVGIELGKGQKLNFAVMGDSAGGNLTAAVVLRAMMLHLPLPKGVHMVYPILNMSTKIWKEQMHLPSHYQNAGHRYQHEKLIASNSNRTDEFANRYQPPSSASSLSKSTVSASMSSSISSIPITATHLPSSPSLSSSSQPSSSKLSIPTGINDLNVNAIVNINQNHANELILPPSSPILTLRPPELTSRCKYAFDGVLPLKYILTLGQALFRTGGDPDADMFASPLLAPDLLMKCFPPTFIHVGEVDPLFDDSIQFAERLRTQQPTLPVKVHVFPGCSHAYMHTSTFMPEGKEAVNLSMQWLQEIFALPLLENKLDQLISRMQQQSALLPSPPDRDAFAAKPISPQALTEQTKSTSIVINEKEAGSEMVKSITQSKL